MGMQALDSKVVALIMTAVYGAVSFRTARLQPCQAKKTCSYNNCTISQSKKQQREMKDEGN